MTPKTTEDLLKKITLAVQTRDMSVIRDFLEEFTQEILEAQRPVYEKMLIGAAEQGILSERERCLKLVYDLLPESDSKRKLMDQLRGEIEQPT